MDGHRRVEEYVQRQRAYLPTYTTENLADARYDQLPRSDAEFGFDTPVLRPRAPSKPQATAQQAEPHRARPPNQRSRKPALPSETRDPALGRKDRPRGKRKEAPTANDTDGERVARLADRRERKRKKRAVVNPPPRHGEPTTAKSKGRTKKPGALALLYGFSATNVTKDRLTLKPAPSLGVFCKGKASAKKKVTATNRSSSRHELFSESAFLNKPSERAADPLKIADDPDDSLISDPPAPRVTRHTHQNPGKHTKTSAARTSGAANGADTDSNVWDIEVQSRLPSSARDVSSEPEAKESTPVVADPCAHGAEWCASVNEEHDKRQNKMQTANLSVSRSRSGERSVVHIFPGTSSGLRDGHCHSDVAGVSSLHPSYSASQVGRRATDTQGSDLRLVTSKYFTEPSPNSPGYPTQILRSGDGICLPDSQDEDVREAVEAGTTHRVASPISSPTSVPLRVAEFKTRYDMDLHEFESDSCPYDDCWGVEVPLGPLERRDHDYFESPIGGTRGDRFISTQEDDHACQDEMWNRYPLVGPAADGAEFEGGCDPLMGGYKDDLEDVDGFFFEEQDEYDSEQEYHMAPIEQAFSVYGEGSTGCDEDSSSAVADFLEGRALLLDVHERTRRGGLSGLIEAERDVASRLRGHWRPLRL